MDSYKWLFHASRFPEKPSDKAHKFDPKTHDHVVFIRKNKFFQVPLTTMDGAELSAAELQVSVCPIHFCKEMTSLFTDKSKKSLVLLDKKREFPSALSLVIIGITGLMLAQLL